MNDRFGSLMQRRLALAMRREGLSDSAQAGLMRDGDWSVGPFTGGAAVRIAHDFYLRNLGPLRLIRDRWRSKDTAALLPSAELEAVEAQMKAFYRAEPSILELIEQGIVLDARRAAVGWELKVKEDANHLGQVDGLGEQTPGFVLITPYLDSTVGASAQTNTYPLRLRMSALAAEADALETRYRAMHVQFTLPPGAPAPRVTAMPRPNAPSNDRLRE
ncbi:MAG: hypothetical protein JO348_01445 [Alphaproteobacteria bacterium]|nr:hypothetical protein [Alphaproteobacteria bacterium]MBV9418413.1 hypothetical protein [Alphaproteobacteria bacterium]